MPHPYLSFVVPVYGSPQSLEPLRDRVRAVCQTMGISYEFILIDDRCPLGSWSAILKLAKETPEIVGIRLSRNFGQHAAINAGLTRARGEWIVVMDCDLQDQPEEVPPMLAMAIEGRFEAVRARRSYRNDSWFRRAISRAFYLVFSFLTDTHQSAEIANFGVYHRKIVDAINCWQEETKYFPAIVEWVGFSQATMPVSHGKRFDGRSSYNFSKLLRLGMNVVTGFSDKPLKILMATGLFLALGSFGASLFLVISYELGVFTVEGWTSVMLSLWFFAGCIIFGVGLAGLYIGRVLVEAKGRPTFIIDEDLAERCNTE